MGNNKMVLNEFNLNKSNSILYIYIGTVGIFSRNKFFAERNAVI